MTTYTPKNKRKRVKPTDRTPPGESKKSKESEVCLICDTVIRDGDDPDDALYCEGDCQGWLHRKCVCMTKKLYVALGQSDDPYLCPHCAFAEYEQEIDSLKDQVKSLSEELTLLNMQQSKSNNFRDNTFPDSVNALHSETNQPVNPDNNQQSVTQIPTVSNTGLFKPPNGILPGDRKFNVIIFGLKECPKGTPRPDRYKSDLNESISIMTKVNTDKPTLCT